MRHAIVLLVASFVAGCGSGSGSTVGPLPVAPPSALTVAAPTGTITGDAVATMIQDTSDCPPAYGIGLRAATGGADVTVVFPRWPDEGAVYDVSVPGASDFVTVSARAAGHTYCVAEEGAVGTVVVNRFEEIAGRWLVDVSLTGVAAGATTIDAHLYH
ncbi:MAG TPA: hypothetical protein VF334_02035 [Polyangia bacterium]